MVLKSILFDPKFKMTFGSTASFYCPYVLRLGMITPQTRQTYPTILCLVSFSLTPNFSNPKFALVERS